MSFRARVSAGRVVLEDPFDFPDGTALDIVVHGEASLDANSDDTPHNEALPAREAIERVRAILADHLWCDWQVIRCAGAELVVGGGDSLSYDPKILLTFHGVDVFSGKLDWSTEPGGLYIAADTEADQLNLQFGVVAGVGAERVPIVFINSHFDNRKVLIAAQTIALSGEWTAARRGEPAPSR